MPVSSDERTEIMSRHQQGKDNAQIAATLKLPLRTVSSVVAWEKIRQTEWWKSLHHDGRTDEAEQVETAIEATFGLERDLQSALRANIQQLEKGLRIADSGKEQSVPSGRIDILGKDSKGISVVIELKAGTADRDAIGQILSYMGDMQTAGHPKVKGFLVAGDFTPRAIAAARAANVVLRKYSFNFSFEQV
jgi:RecB family endonuclease NucS